MKPVLSKQELLLHIRSMSAGTLAHLFQVTDYDEVDREARAWHDWVAEQSRDFANWSEAYQAYQESRGAEVIR